MKVFADWCPDLSDILQCRVPDIPPACRKAAALPFAGHTLAQLRQWSEGFTLHVGVEDDV